MQPMQTQIISAPSDALYLSDFMEGLPLGILNKKATGVGASSIAIFSKDAYIVACPTVELILNKKSQHKNIFGIYYGVTFESFKSYMEDAPSNFKIFTTYDSLDKTTSWLSRLDIDAYTRCKLLVDEYHKILSDYSYRDKAINSLLEESLRFKYYTFLSATPINPKYTPKELKDVPYYEIEWSTLVKKKPERIKTNKPFQAAVNIIKQYKLGNYSITKKINGQDHLSKEAYFFVNSVKAIKDIIDNANLLPSEVKIICSDTPRNREVLDIFPISHVSYANKPFTFITSKSFLGVDIYSDSGIAYVISNVNKKTTLLDISTDIYQIAGRIRNTNNPFKDTICHIYNLGTSDMAIEEFKAIVQQKVEDTYAQIEVFNNASVQSKKAILKRFEMDMDDDYSYYNFDTNLLEFNEFKKLNEEFNFEIINGIYKNGLSVRESYIKAGFDISNNQEFINVEESFFENLARYSFKEILKEYCQLLETDEKNPRIKQIESLEPDIKSYVNCLGIPAIRTLKYVRGSIKLAIYNSCDEVTDALSTSLKERFKSGTFYSSEEIKKVMAEEFQKLKIKKAAKATTITNYVPMEYKAKKIKGKVVKGYLLL